MTKTLQEHKWSKCQHCGGNIVSYNKRRKYCGRKCWANYCAKNLGDWTHSDRIGARNKEVDFRNKVSNGLKLYYQKHRIGFLKGQRTDWRIRTWRGIKEMILQRDHCKCIRCGTTGRLDVHHIVPERAGGANITRNLISLCRSCHQFVEKNQLAIYQIVKNWRIVAILTRDSFSLNIR